MAPPIDSIDRRRTDLDADWQLIVAVADGSPDALGRLYDRYGAIVYALARRIVSRLEDAEEVVQDVFAQVWRQAGQYRTDRASVAGWIIMLARTRAIACARFRARCRTCGKYRPAAFSVPAAETRSRRVRPCRRCMRARPAI